MDDDEVKRIHTRLDEVTRKSDAAYSASENAMGSVMALKDLQNERHETTYRDLDRVYEQVEKLFKLISDSGTTVRNIGVTIILMLITAIGIMIWELIIK